MKALEKLYRNLFIVCQMIMKVRRVHPLGIINVCTKLATYQ